MKHTFTHKILPALAGTALALALAIGFAPQIRAQVGNLFHTGGGNYGAQRFELAAKMGNDNISIQQNNYLENMPIFGDSNHSQPNAIFRMAGTALFDNVMSFGQTRLEKLVIGSQLLGANAFDPLAGYALDVNGSIAVRKFSNDQNKSHYLCADDFGKLVISENEDCGSAPAPTAVDGQCGVAQGKNYSDVPPQSELCSAGTASAVTTNTSSYTWTCQGENGGSDASCTAKRVSKVDGKCGASHYNCDAGTAINKDEGSSAYTWTCQGENGGSDASCQEEKQTQVWEGCYIGRYDYPDSVHPNGGKVEYHDANGSLAEVTGLWNNEPAAHISYTDIVQTTAAHQIDCKSIVDAQCASNHYKCSKGTPVNDINDTSTQYRWHCNSDSHGTNATCVETKVINGECAIDDHYNCKAGTSVNDIADTKDKYLWHCNGINGGTNATCSEDKVVGPPSCFIAGTKVTMADGSEKNIEEVKIGEFVLGNNGEVSEVKGLHRPLLGEGRSTKLYSFNGGPYFVNSDHPFLTTEGWKAMDPIEAEKVHRMFKVTQLHVGDTLITKDGLVLLEQIDEKEGDPSTQLYNLMLGGNHTYIADGYIVHNLK